MTQNDHCFREHLEITTKAIRIINGILGKNVTIPWALLEQL